MKRSKTKAIAKVCLAISFLLTGNVLAQSSPQDTPRPLSDLALLQEFQADYDALNTATLNVNNIATYDSLLRATYAFKERYAPFTLLINSVDESRSFKDLVANLKSSLEQSRYYLDLTDEQARKLEEFTLLTRSLESELAESRENLESVTTELTKQKGNYKKVSELAGVLRSKLVKRDRMISAFVDESLHLQGPSGYPGGNETLTKRAISPEALKLIASATSDLTQTVETSGAHLMAEDYIRMLHLQERLDLLWKRHGEGLVNVYAADQDKARQVEETAVHITRLGDTINGRLIQAFKLELANVGVSETDISSFADVTIAFATHVMAVSNPETDMARKEEAVMEVQLSEFWNNRYKRIWAGFLVETGAASYEQIMTVDQDLTDWRRSLQPVLNPAYFVAGVSISIIFVLCILLFKLKMESVSALKQHRAMVTA